MKLLNFAIEFIVLGFQPPNSVFDSWQRKKNLFFIANLKINYLV